MQKINLLTYSDSNYEALQATLSGNAIFSGAFDFVISKNRNQLEETDFYRENKEILDQKRGAGYWLWKPYFILEELKKMPPNDILMYIDCGDELQDLSQLRAFLFSKMENLDMLLTKGAFKNGIYTKRDCFVLMGCDNQAYYDEIQMEAGILVFKNTAQTQEIVQKWLTYCKNIFISTDIPNVGTENLPGFIDHRHDQSVLTNLSIIFNLYSSSEMRQFVTCNKNSI